MPEEQAFSVLVKIMFDYGLRDLFKQNFEDLHCKFFQLERLMQVCVCVLHLEVQSALFLMNTIAVVIFTVGIQLVYLLTNPTCHSLFNLVSLFAF